MWLAEWKRAYVVTDLIGSARMVVDPCTSKGNLIVEIARRVGGATLDTRDQGAEVRRLVARARRKPLAR